MKKCAKTCKICAKSDPMHKLPIQFNYDNIDIYDEKRRRNESIIELPYQIRCGKFDFEGVK